MGSVEEHQQLGASHNPGWVCAASAGVSASTHTAGAVGVGPAKIDEEGDGRQLPHTVAVDIIFVDGTLRQTETARLSQLTQLQQVVAAVADSDIWPGNESTACSLTCVTTKDVT